jgi:hypothetical protein
LDFRHFHSAKLRRKGGLTPFWIPDLLRAGYSATSSAATDYNCIAWAAGVTNEWWWPDPIGIYSWPAGARREETVVAFVEAFQTLG